MPGNDIVLTLDRSVQYAAEQALLKRVAELGARGGQAVVMGSKTGEVIAMASVRINDEGYYEITSGNYSAVDAYEPGSVGKVITISGALNEGTVTPESSFVVPWQKVYTNRGDRLHDSHMHGDEVMDVQQILVESSNIGTITVSETMGFERQYHYMRAFGLGERTALNFPDETAGILHPWQEWEGTEKYTVAYGQGVASSPIQLVSAVNTIANDGTYVAPKLVKATVDASGEVREMPESETREVVSTAVAEQMQTMMREVVCRGTAKQAQRAGAVDRRQDRHRLHRPARWRLRAPRRVQGLLRELRRVPPGGGSAGDDPRVHRPAAPGQQRPLRRHGGRPGVP